MSSTVDDLLVVLNAIDRGETVPQWQPPVEDRSREESADWDRWCGDVTFTADGWRIVVFNDCGSWDYIDHVVSPSGDRVEFGNLPFWEPDHPELWLVDGKPFNDYNPPARMTASDNT